MVHEKGADLQLPAKAACAEPHPRNPSWCLGTAHSQGSSCTATAFSHQQSSVLNTRLKTDAHEKLAQPSAFTFEVKFWSLSCFLVPETFTSSHPVPNQNPVINS